MQALKKILSSSNTYELPIARNYVRHWGMTEAVRELLQNAIDSESAFEYDLEKEDDGTFTLMVHSRQSHLTPETLLLGQTSKADDKDTIGSFGEGYKIALLVLAREGYQVFVRNRDRIWRPRFAHSNTFKAEVLCIEDTPAPSMNEGLTFVVAGLSAQDVEKIRQSCLFLQTHIGQIIRTNFGTILLDRPGKLYTGGLYVCNTELHYGYDVKPEFLKLERDRKTVDSFDLQWLAKDMWLMTERFDEIASLVEKGTPDLKYVAHGAPDLVKEACYKLFQKNHPGAVIASSQKELEELVAKGMQKVVVISGSFGEIVRTSRDYQKRVPVISRRPVDVLKAWFSDNRDLMRKDAIVSFKDVIKQAESWRV